MTSCALAREELAKVSSLVMTARRLLAGGTLVDLTAIEDRVRSICGCIEALPREEGRSLTEDMQALMNRLDQLAEELRDHLAQLASAEADRPSRK